MNICCKTVNPARLPFDINGTLQECGAIALGTPCTSRHAKAALPSLHYRIDFASGIGVPPQQSWPGIAHAK
jgi:hypothetical protein